MCCAEGRGESAEMPVAEDAARGLVAWDVSAVGRLGYLYRSGVDKEGRVAFVLVASRFQVRCCSQFRVWG